MKEFNSVNEFVDAVVGKVKTMSQSASFVGVVKLSLEKGTRARPDNYYGSYHNCIINYRYYNSIKKALSQVDTLKKYHPHIYEELVNTNESPKERAWGHHVDGCYGLIYHNGEYYIETKELKSRKLFGKSIKNVTASQIKQWEKEKIVNIKHRDIKLSNVVEINIDGEKFVCVPNKNLFNEKMKEYILNRIIK